MECHLFELSSLNLLFFFAEVVDSSAVLDATILIDGGPNVLDEWLDERLDNPVLNLLPILSLLLNFLRRQRLFRLFRLRAVALIDTNVSKIDRVFHCSS